MDLLFTLVSEPANTQTTSIELNSWGYFLIGVIVGAILTVLLVLIRNKVKDKNSKEEDDD